MSVKAYVLNDGTVIKQSTLESFARTDHASRQIDDPFKGTYKHGLVKPPYALEALANLLDMNVYHARACRVKSVDVVGHGWKVKRYSNSEQGDLDSEAERTRNELDAFFRFCHPIRTFDEIMTDVALDYEMTGNGYLELVRNEAGHPVGLDHIPSHTVRAHRDQKRYAQVRGAKTAWFVHVGVDQDVHRSRGALAESGRLEFSERGGELIHFKNYSGRSSYYGVPEVIPALGAILGDRERAEYNLDFFGNHAVPAYAVTVSGADLDPNTEDQIKRFFQRDLKENRHSTLVLTAGSDDPDAPPVKFQFEKLAVGVEEASFRLYREDNRDEVLSAHGVPPYRVGVNVSGALAGNLAKEATEIYKESVIEPRQNAFEARLTRLIIWQDFNAPEWVISFNRVDMRDEHREARVLDRRFRMGAWTPNEVREATGKPRSDHPAMDRHYIDNQPLTGTNDELDDAVTRAMKGLHREMLEAIQKEN